MIVQLEQLSLHPYTEDDIYSKATPTLMKGMLEMNKVYNDSHRFSVDIANSDVVFSLGIDETRTDIGYVFITKECSNDSTSERYTINKVILDENLSVGSIKYLIANMINANFNSDFRTKRYIKAVNQYVIYENTKNESIESIADEICQGFIDEKEGMTSNPIIKRILERTKF